MKVLLDIKTVSEMNRREHWRPRAARAKRHREAARVGCSCAERDFGKLVKLPVSVKLVRVGLRKLDGDNLQGALKHVRDGIADWLGVDDGDETRVSWEYGQRIGKPVGIEVEVIPWYAD